MSVAVRKKGGREGGNEGRGGDGEEGRGGGRGEGGK